VFLGYSKERVYRLLGKSDFGRPQAYKSSKHSRKPNHNENGPEYLITEIRTLFVNDIIPISLSFVAPWFNDLFPVLLGSFDMSIR